MSGGPPSTGRALWALVRVGMLRWRNRVFGRFLAAFRRKGAPRRRATLPKRTAFGSLQLVLALMMVGGAFGMAAGLLVRLVEQIHVVLAPGKIAAPPWVYDQIRRAEQAEREIELAGRGGPAATAASRRASTAPSSVGPPGASQPASRPAGSSLRQAVRRRVLERHGFLFRQAARRHAGPFGDEMRAEYAARRAYLQRGLEAFHRTPVRKGQVLPTPADWTRPHSGRVLRRAVGVILTGLVLMLLFRSFAAANLDLATPQWSVEWFFMFPVPAGVIFAARLVRLTVLNAFSWLTVFPLLVLTYLSAGLGWWGPPAAAGVTLAINAIIAAVQVAGETWMRRRLSPARRNNIVGLATICQMLFFVGTMAVAATPQATGWLLGFSARLPEAVAGLPTLLPLEFCRPDAAVWPGMVGLGIVGMALPVLAAAACGRMVRGGLIAQTASAARRGPTTWPGGPAGLGGMVGKELLLLARDRSFLAQTIVLPIVLCLFQVVMNPALFRAASRDFQHATAVAFGTGAYVVLMSGARLLVGEVRSLWLLYTLPERLDKLLFRKIALWAVFGTAFATGIWLLLAGRHGPLRPIDSLNALIALGGVGIYGCVSAGLSALGTEATTQRPRVSASVVYLNMVLGGVYVSAIYAPAVWQKAVIVAMFLLVACAVWQKVRERIGYLLDPTQQPPPALDLSDAVICLFGFVTLQALLALLMGRTGLGLIEGLAVSYVAAGAVVAGLSLLVFWRRKVPSLARRLGLRAPPDRPAGTWSRAVAVGVAFGLAAGALGAGYQVLITRTGWLRQFAPPAPLQEALNAGGAGWLVALAVLAAPPLEEYLFRGLMYGALVRLTRPALAIAASAAAFAAVHPPVAFPAVFALGVAAALAFRATGLLLAPVLTHMLYNAVVSVMAALL